MSAQAVDLVATLRLKDQLTRQAGGVIRTMDTLNARTKTLQAGVARLQRGLSTGLANSAKIAGAGIAFLAYNIKQGIDELVEWEDAQLQIAAALKSTNAVAGVTAKMTEDLAQKYAELSNYEDDVVLGAEALLLRFPNIRKKAFEPTLQAAIDLAAATGKDLPTATRTLAMALNDPVAGLGRLTRQGITFTDQQKAQIKTLAESGKSFKAQEIILRQVNKQYGGSGKKATEGYRGNVIAIQKAIKDLQQALAAPLVEPLKKISKAMVAFAKTPEFAEGLTKFGEAIASFVTTDNIQKVADGLKEGFGFIEGLDWKGIGAGFQMAADIAKQSVSLFKSLPTGVQSALITLLAANKLTGGLVGDTFKGLAGLILNNLRTITAANVTVIGANVATPQTPIPTTSVVTSLAAAVASSPALAVTLGALGATLVGDQLLGPAVRSVNPTYDKQYGEAFGGKTLIENLGAWLMGQTFEFNGNTFNEGARANPALAAQKSAINNYALLRFIGLGGGQRPTGASRPTRSGNFGGSSIPNLPVDPVKFFDKLDGLFQQGKVSREYAVKLFEETQSGTKTYRQALKELREIKGAQGEVQAAIKGQRYQFTLKPSVTISASATGNAITFAANGQRLEIL